MPDDVLLGFDGSVDGDVSVVVMRRGPDGTWRVESTDGPPDFSAHIAELVAQHQPDEPPLSDLARDWLTRTAAQPFTLEPLHLERLRELIAAQTLTPDPALRDLTTRNPMHVHP